MVWRARDTEVDRVRGVGKAVLERRRGRVGARWVVNGVDRRAESLVDIRGMPDHIALY